MKISELKEAIREIIVSELTEAESFLVKGKTKQIPMSFPNRTAAQKYDTENTNVTVEPLEEDTLNEMASLVQASKEARRQGKNQEAEALEATEEKTIEQFKTAGISPDPNTGRLKGFFSQYKKNLKNDFNIDLQNLFNDLEVQAEEDGESFNASIAVNSIEKTAANKLTGKEVGQRGRKADPNKPAKEPKEKGVPGRPKGSTKSNDALAFTMGGNVSISGKNVSPAEKKKAVRAAEKNKPIELLKIKDIAVIDTEINDLASELKSKIPTAKQISSKGDDSRYTEEEAAFMNDLKSKSERLKQLKATREKLQTKSIRRQDRNIDVANVDLD